MDRLDFKLQESKKKVYQRAAEIAGESLTAFAVSAMDARAEAVIRAHDTTVLTPEESVTFIDLMRAPLAQNPQLSSRFAELEAYLATMREYSRLRDRSTRRRVFLRGVRLWQ